MPETPIDPCPCRRDQQGKCPCDPNQDIISGVKQNLNNVLSFAGNAIYGGAQTGVPNPAAGTLGGAISGLTTGGPIGAIFGALNGLITTGQAREDYERTQEDRNTRYIKDRTFMPEYAASGGMFEDDLQAEDGEVLVLPTLEISDVKATKKHKDMKATEVTDIVPKGTVVFSDQKKIDLKKYKDIKLSEAISFYDDQDRYEYGELTVGDILGEKGELTFAEAANKAKKYYPTTKEKSLVSEETNQLNLAARAPIISFLFGLQSGENIDMKKEKVPKAAGGWPNYREMLKNLGILDDEEKKPGQTMFDDPGLLKKNNRVSAGNNLISTRSNDINASNPDSYPYDTQGMDYKSALEKKALDVARENNWSDEQLRDYLDNYIPDTVAKDMTDRTGFAPVKPSTEKYNPYGTIADPQQSTPLITDNSTAQTSPQLYNSSNPNSEVAQGVATSTAAPVKTQRQNIEELSSYLRGKYGERRGELDKRYANDKESVAGLIKGKKANNALQLGNQVLFSGLQSGYSDPALESTSLIDDQFRDTPLALVDQQSDALASGANSTIKALNDAGVSPGDIARYASGVTENVLDAQGGLRSRNLEASTANNKAKIAEFRNVIQGNNQKLADQTNKLQDFNNKKIASVGEFLNSYLTNDNSIDDTNYKLNKSGETDYAQASNAINKAEDQLKILETGADNNSLSANSSDIMSQFESLSEEEKKKLLDQLTGNSRQINVQKIPTLLSSVKLK